MGERVRKTSAAAASPTGPARLSVWLRPSSMRRLARDSGLAPMPRVRERGDVSAMTPDRLFFVAGVVNAVVAAATFALGFVWLANVAAALCFFAAALLWRNENS